LRERLTKKNQSIEKMFNIIETMADNHGPMRLQDISRKVKYPASTVLRMLNSMVSCGYVYQDADTLKYSLSPKFSKIGEAVRSQYRIQDIVRPHLIELTERCHESSCLAIEDNMMVVYLDVVESADKMLRTFQKIGKEAPMHCTGVGKLLLLNYSPSQIKEFVEKKGLEMLTQNTITTYEELLEELETVRQQGYAMDNEECEDGARCIAAPIRDYSGKIIAGISISGPTNRITLKRIKPLKDILLEISSRISEKLGYTGQ